MNKQNHPGQFDYDQRSFCLDGERKFLIMGEVHYTRSTPGMWPGILDRSVALGLNCLATYVFWSAHEPEAGRFDFEGNSDIGAFLELCHERGLKVFLRIGPYCCAEYNYGGFPAWLRDIPGCMPRTWNGPYMRRVTSYFEKLAQEVRPYLASQGGPVVAIQVENEYNNISKRYGEEGQRYLAWIVDAARAVGFDVPTITCEGGAPGAIEALNNFGHSDEAIIAHRSRHPESPLVWTELWVSWYQTWGFQKHLRSAEDIAYHILRWVARGGCAWNYYMWHGGTNFGRQSMYLQTTSYDFDAPLDEYGAPTVKGNYLGELHHLLRKNENLLLSADPGIAEETKGAWTATWGDLALRFDDLTRRASIFQGGQVLFDTAESFNRHASQSRPGWEPLTSPAPWHSFPEPIPDGREPGALTANQPVEQLLVTHDQSDYCWYLCDLKVEEDGPHTLKIPRGADLLTIFIDGHEAASFDGPLWEIRGRTEDTVDEHPPANPLEERTQPAPPKEFTFSLSPGEHRLAIRCASVGLIKGDWMIAAPMIFERKGIWSSVFLNGKELTGWTMVGGLSGERDRLPERGAFAFQSTPSQTGPAGAWHSATFSVDEKMRRGAHSFRVDLGQMGKGLVWVNGHCLGRYWSIPASGWGLEDWSATPFGFYLETSPMGTTQRYYHLPGEWLKAENQILIYEERARDPRGVSISVRRDAEG